MTPLTNTGRRMARTMPPSTEAELWWADIGGYHCCGLIIQHRIQRRVLNLRWAALGAEAQADEGEKEAWMQRHLHDLDSFYESECHRANQLDAKVKSTEVPVVTWRLSRENAGALAELLAPIQGRDAEEDELLDILLSRLWEHSKGGLTQYIRYNPENGS